MQEDGDRIIIQRFEIYARNLHSGKTNSVKQEIYANLIMHNFCRINSSFAEVKKNKGGSVLKVNYSTAVSICKAFLKGLCPLENVIFLIEKNLLLERPGRKLVLDLAPKKFSDFRYRAA